MLKIKLQFNYNKMDYQNTSDMREDSIQQDNLHSNCSTFLLHPLQKVLIPFLPVVSS